MREQIINKAAELFCSYGFKTTTTSELAKALGISKKTLYEYYPSKDAIILEVLCHKQEQIKSLWEWDITENVIVEVFDKIQELMELLRISNSRAIWELQKYYPNMFADFQQYHKLHSVECVRKFIIKGMEQGFFREDIDVDFMVYWRFGLSRIETDPEVFPEGVYSLPFLIKKNMELFLRLLCNERGLEELEKVKKNYIRQ